MRWTLPFNGRIGNGKRKNGNGSDAHGARPDFLCVGVHKGGTTWLYQQLDYHPDFWMPPLKELHYFDQLSRVQRSSSSRCRDERDLRFLESINSLITKPYIDFEHYARLFEPKGPLLSGDTVERVWSHLSMEVHYHQIEAFDVTDIDEVNRNVLRRGMLLRSYPSEVVARWKHHVHPDRFRIYFFDDLQRNPTELRRSILDFLGANPDKPASRVPPDHNSWASMEKLPLTDKVRSHLAQFFQKELKTCASRLGGAARDWPARYGFSLVLFLWDLLDDSIDLFFWCDWIS